MLIQIIIMKHCHYFFIRKTEKLIKGRIGKRIYFKIVQTGKNTFLRNPQTPGENCKFEVFIGFQCISHKSADQRYHLIVITILKSLVKRYIIFVYQKNNRNSIMLL